MDKWLVRIGGDHYLRLGVGRSWRFTSALERAWRGIKAFRRSTSVYGLVVIVSGRQSVLQEFVSGRYCSISSAFEISIHF